jgi:hypothetical protein
MGGMAACMDLRLEYGAGRLPDVAVLMLLDRDADVFLARRSDADGWLVKPLDAIRIRHSTEALLAGGEYREGVGVVPTDEIEPMNVVVPEAASVENPAEPETGMASKLTESAAESDDTAMDTEDNADTDAGADDAEAAEG